MASGYLAHPRQWQESNEVKLLQCVLCGAWLLQNFRPEVASEPEQLAQARNQTSIMGEMVQEWYERALEALEQQLAQAREENKNLQGALETQQQSLSNRTLYAEQGLAEGTKIIRWVIADIARDGNVQSDTLEEAHAFLAQHKA
jgi:Na+/phosphate symporter